MKAEPKYISFINKKLPEQFKIFKLSDVFISDDEKLNIVLLVHAKDYDVKLSEELKSLIFKYTEEILPDEKNILISYKKTITDETYIKTEILKYFYQNHPIITTQIKEEDIDISFDRMNVNVKLFVSKEIKEFINLNLIDNNIRSHLEMLIIEDITIFVVESKKSNFSVQKKQNTSVSALDSFRMRIVNITQKEPLVGAVAKAPVYISDLGRDVGKKVVCGKVSNIKSGMSKKSKRFWQSFKLDDSSGMVKCLIVPKVKDRETISNQIVEGMCIVVDGQYAPPRDSPKGDFTLFIDSVALCDIDYSSIKLEVPFKEVPADYITIEPQKYSEESQRSFFHSSDKLHPKLQGSLVVFDLETTGININIDKIIEIGAVKMIDGIMTETFETFVNPGEGISIPPDASRVNNIYDIDVRDAPLFKEVVSDFYKFCYGSTLVAHNSAFDVGMITYYSRQHSYNFDNNVIDTLKLAREILHKTSGVSLDALRKKFNIDTGKAHRALTDAFATAILLQELLKIT